MNNLYTPPGFNPYASQATWDKDIFHGPFPRGGRRKRKTSTYWLALAALAVVTGAVMGIWI